MSARLAAVVFACLAFLSSAHAANYYVAPDGSDFSSGLWPASPFKTIQKAMNTAGPGDTVHIRGGTYREQVELVRGGGEAGKPLTVKNYAGEFVVIKGSDVVTGWTHHAGNIWKRTNWRINSQQVFVDFDDARPTAGPKPLQQIGMPSPYYTATWEYNSPVGNGLADMMPGSFYYDPAEAVLYVWLADGSNPNDHVVEASVRRRIFFMGRPWITLDGLHFRHSNLSAFAQQGAAVELSSNSTVTRCDIQFTDFAGVSLGYLQTNGQVLLSNISNNGSTGINAVAASKFRIAGNTINANNTRNFNPLWHAGGIKGVTDAWGNIEFNVVAYNKGSGIWFDYTDSGQPIVIRFNYVHDNGPKDSGIFMEVAKNVLIHNNVISNNTRRGVYVAASSDVRVLNNTIAGTAGHAGIEVGGMPRAGASLTNNQILNNIISHGSTLHDLLITPPNGTTIAGNTSNHNLIWRSGAAIRLWSGNSYGDLAAWREATGHDTNSVSGDPMFFPVTNPPSATNYKLRPGSPAVDTGLNLLTVYNRDYLGTLRPMFAGFDIGALELK